MAMRWRVAVLAMICWSGAAQAQTGSAGRVVRSLTECRAIAEPQGRLACFDKAVVALETAVAAKEVTIVDRQDIRKAKRSLFGFTLPRIDLFGGGGRDDDVEAFKEINATVARARPAGSGRAEIELAEEGGALWRTTDPMPFPPKVGAKVRIRQGTLGNYFLFVDGRSYRSMRVR